MKLQTFFPKSGDLGPHNSINLQTLGNTHVERWTYRRGKDWQKYQLLRQDTFLLNMLEGYQTLESVGYTHQQDYVKLNFWLGGRLTTILHGFGQHDHDSPEVFITSGPVEMIKIDLRRRETHLATVALCLKREFFPRQMGLELDELPEPLRAVLVPESRAFAFLRYSLTPQLIGTVRSILAAPVDVRVDPIYGQAKAVELMCLLIDHLQNDTPGARRSNVRHSPRLHEARDLLNRNFDKALTVDQIGRAVGLNRVALTNGFRELFGLTVYDYLQKLRMERAQLLLQDESQTISSVAEMVGYSHASNFSSAFRQYFGCAPRKARSRLSRT